MRSSLTTRRVVLCGTLAVLSIMILLTDTNGRNTSMGKSKGVDDRLIRGTIFFDTLGRGFVGATLNIQVEDTTDSDASADKVAELSIKKFSAGGPNARTFRFVLGELELSGDSSYNVRVHLDTNNDGKIGKGDYISYGQNPASMNRDISEIKVQIVN